MKRIGNRIPVVALMVVLLAGAAAQADELRDAVNQGDEVKVAELVRKNPSSVTRANRSLRKNGCQTCGSLLNAHMPRNVVSAASRIADSYATGMFAGIDHVGLPEMFHVHACAFAYHCKSKPPIAPAKPPPKMTSGRIVRLIPIAGSMPCTGNGVKASNSV